MNTRVAAGAVAVVGAGMAGLAAARALGAAGVPVTLFDKGRSAGGRVATRRVDGWQFDHGAQFFTARTAPFAALVAEAAAAGAVAAWAGPFATLAHGQRGPDPRPGQVRWVGLPGMSGLVRFVAQGLPVVASVRIDRVGRGADGWWLHGEALGPAPQPVQHGPFAAVVLAIPPAQAVALLAGEPAAAVAHAAAVAQAAALQPCLAAMVAFVAPLPAAAGGLWLDDPVLAFTAHDGGKPGRGDLATYVLHSTAPFALAHWDAPPATWGAQLLAAFGAALGGPLPAVQHLGTHRWRYALAAGEGAAAGCAGDPAAGLWLCGDAFAGGRVEGAFTSGAAAAAALLAARG